VSGRAEIIGPGRPGRAVTIRHQAMAGTRRRPGHPSSVQQRLHGPPQICARCCCARLVRPEEGQPSPVFHCRGRLAATWLRQAAPPAWPMPPARPRHRRNQYPLRLKHRRHDRGDPWGWSWRDWSRPGAIGPLWCLNSERHSQSDPGGRVIRGPHRTTRQIQSLRAAAVTRVAGPNNDGVVKEEEERVGGPAAPARDRHERAESRRVDNQLRGAPGAQGTAGSTPLLPSRLEATSWLRWGIGWPVL